MTEPLEKLLTRVIDAVIRTKHEIEFDGDTPRGRVNELMNATAREIFAFSIGENEIQIGQTSIHNPNEEALTQAVHAHYAPALT